MDKAFGFQTVDLRLDLTRILLTYFFLFIYFFFIIIIYVYVLPFVFFPEIFSHKTWYSIYKIRPCRIWMHVSICFSVVHFLTWTFSLSLRNLYSVTLVHGYKLIIPFENEPCHEKPCVRGLRPGNTFYLTSSE